MLGFNFINSNLPHIRMPNWLTATWVGAVVGLKTFILIGVTMGSLLFSYFLSLASNVVHILV